MASQGARTALDLASAGISGHDEVRRRRTEAIDGGVQSSVMPLKH
jgi:hypothetical protein